MPFGIKSAPEIFQQKMNLFVEGLEGVEVIADDVLIFGEGETTEEATKDHDIKLKAFLTRCKNQGVKINKEKMKLRQTELTYMGHVLTENGMKPDPRKIEAINNLKIPTNVE